MKRREFVAAEARLLDTWKKIRRSPGIMYDTPYPSSDTGPKPPPGLICGGIKRTSVKYFHLGEKQELVVLPCP